MESGGIEMKLTVLMDNNTIIDRYFLGEPGVSYLLEVDDRKILFDTGYSDAYLLNGQKMGIHFFDLDAIVLSHSHMDHTWGLEPLIKRFSEEVMEGRQFQQPILVAHPQIFDSKTFFGTEEFGVNVDPQKLAKYMTPQLTREPFWLTDHLVFLGEIPRKNAFEARKSIGKVRVGDMLEDDYSMDDSALCYTGPEGLVIITGCSHAGICNIMEHARAVCGDERVHDVIGGFHLLDPEEEQMNGTAAYFQSRGVKQAHPCHCTDLKSKIELAKWIPVEEVGVGLVLEYT
ncbi:7,8-dihydropterin-6-yl-methyl-4-(beta-D-ribofuranosyl)aminobenzene 5'-phosphate synthase [Anoxynatronum buryatiense]|uniref:7,8-dihydropterin-6-yl-methyl-4-(Beta-D-ribofuranosyl)aminobenzene 5'-phosphate synthase n=2 Tax=Anoxynatronum buryatiense TaxID=489973 RepID=A0AA45WU26_9CLOT|nr:7,8-dihydropterin-6-yl-methyl-4-(beta-D-ribofuranosyl)aminobenzene 5'-phosphate synthase [Anoxynatronum buryatiense]